MELRVFWLVAIVACVAAFAFAIKVRVSTDAAQRDEFQRLRAGQEKDDWLVCAVVWVNVLCERTEASRIVAAVGVAALCWLAVRTFKRLHRLTKPRQQLS
jgi:cobalamin synthase